MSLYEWSNAFQPIAGLSRPPKARIDPFGYQTAGVQQILHARAHSFCAHHPGAGKTPMALIASLAYAPSEPVLVVCPPSICYQWARQGHRWTGLPWLVCDNTHDIRAFLHRMADHIPARFIVPDSLVHQIPDTGERIALLIADEAHRLKTRDARRTRAFFGHGVERGLRQRAEKVLCLSGTPMPNNPTELYPFLHACFPSLAPNFAAFAARYCPPEKEWVWRGAQRQEIIVYKTAINKDELARKLRETGFIRPKRADILGQLPPLREDRLPIKLGVRSDLSAQEILKAWTGRDEKTKAALATERRELGILKAENSLAYLETVIDGGDCPVIWTWHVEAARVISNALKLPSIVGSDTPAARRDALDSFIGGRAKGLVATIGAAGTGVDGLQNRTDLAIFVERHYGAVEMEQAYGRLWRTGQKNATRVVIVESDHPIDFAIDAALARKTTDAAEIIG